MSVSSKSLFATGMAVVSLLALVLLAGGIGEMRLQPGTLLAPQTLGELKSLVSGFGVYRNYLLLLLILLPVLALILSRRRRQVVVQMEQPRKRNHWVTLLQVLMWVVALLVLRNQVREGGILFQPPTVGQLPPMEQGAAVQPPEVYLPPWLAYGVSFLLVGLIGVLGWWFLRRKPQVEAPFERIIEQAQTALKDLESGGDVYSVILRCYRQMNRVVRLKRGVRRGEAVTAREFEATLVGLGLPAEAVRQLTRLFEMVRYSNHPVSQEDEKTALTCLRQILQSVEPRL